MNKIFIFFEIILIFIFGPLLFYFDIISFHLWMRATEVGFVVTIILSFIYQTKIKNLGLRIDNLRESFIAFGLLTVIGIIALVVIRNLVTYQSRDTSFWWGDWRMYAATIIFGSIFWKHKEDKIAWLEKEIRK